MNLKSLPLRLRQAALLGLVGSAFLCAGSASAAGGAYDFQIVNDTLSGGGSPFSVTDDVTFTNLQVTETFADNFSQTIGLGSLDTGAAPLESSFSFFDASPTGFSDPNHGLLTSAVLDGNLVISGLIPGSTLDLTLQPALNPPDQFPQTVQTNFSTTLIGAQPSTSGVGVGQFSLLDINHNIAALSGNPLTAQINAAPVPEASTVASFGLMLALGLGGLIVARRRQTATGAK